MMNNKMAQIKLIGKIIIVLIIVGFLAFVVPKMLHGSISQIEVEKCKKTYDYDKDNLLIADKCPCDYGGIEDYNYFMLKGAPYCVMAYKSETETDKYIFNREGSTVDRKTCENEYSELFKRADSKANCPQDSKKALTDGFSKDCADEVLQKDPKTDTFVRKCPTSEFECNEDLVKECRKNPSKVI